MAGRARFQGGNLGAWLAQVAHNAAIDALRRRRREVEEPETRGDDVDPARFDEEVEAKMLVERFKPKRGAAHSSVTRG